MLYEIDSFGFVPGFIKGDLKIMSEEDLMTDEKLRKSLEITKYDSWKRRNIMELISEYDRMIKDENFFESFCKNTYENFQKKKFRSADT